MTFRDIFNDDEPLMCAWCHEPLIDGREPALDVTDEGEYVAVHRACKDWPTPILRLVTPPNDPEPAA